MQDIEERGLSEMLGEGGTVRIVAPGAAKRERASFREAALEFGGSGGQEIKPEVATEAESAAEASALANFARSVWAPLIVGGLALFGLGQVAPPSFMAHFTVFVLSCFIGYMVIWNVSPSLHTPLMSVTNAISSIIILGALTQISSDSVLIYVLAGIAVFITCINIVGGFSVTQRMLKMFRG